MRSFDLPLALLLAFAGCAHGTRVRTNDLVADTSAFLDAYYGGDKAAFSARTAPSFVHFEGGHVRERAAELSAMKPRPPFTRTWQTTRVIAHAHGATFIGHAVEHQADNGSHGNRAIDGWYTVEWADEPGGPRVVYVGWEPFRSALENARDYWNDIYRQDIGFEHQPNRLLARAIAGVTPGRALDVAAGQGRNAVFLAQQGWTVTAIDIAEEGLRRAQEAAGRAGVPLTTVVADADGYDYGRDKWDLVALIYTGNYPDARLQKIRDGLKPGGLVVIEYFLDVGDGGVTPDQFARAFAGFHVITNDVVEDRPDWGADHAKLVRFVARK